MSSKKGTGKSGLKSRSSQQASSSVAANSSSSGNAAIGGQANVNVQSHFGIDSIKMIAESIGITNLSDESSRVLADDVLHRLKLIIQESQKFCSHSKRSLMTINDVDYSLKVKNIEPLYGITSLDHIPFRYASGNGRELYFVEEKEIDLTDAISTINLPKLPQDVAIKSHWLCIEGLQPSIPENPPPLDKEIQRKESIDPTYALKNSQHSLDPTKLSLNQQNDKRNKKHLEIVRIKQYATHELSVEQQLYYKEITEACVGSDESRRSEALQSLTYDSGLHQMLPRLCTFISEGVKVNVVQNNLALLIYLMRMVKAVLDNQTLYLEKYLHEIIPTVITCIVSKQLCMRPDVDNHWALRDFASRLLAQVCKNFNTSTNNIQTRITRLLSCALDNEKLPLSSQYGAISALCELGTEVQRAFVFKRLLAIGEKMRFAIEVTPNVNPVEKSAAEHIRNIIMRVLPPTLKNSRSPPDILDDYKNEFGYLGPNLHSAVVRSRNVSTPLTAQTITQQQQSSINTTQFNQQTIKQPITLTQTRNIQITNTATANLAGAQLMNQRRLNPTLITPQQTSTQQRFVILNNNPIQRGTNNQQFIKIVPGTNNQAQKIVYMQTSNQQTAQQQQTQNKVDELMIIETNKQ